jgi:glycosyltransferase involved in cell wall biosynthesis
VSGGLDVALVIPAHNAEATLQPCLEAVVPLLERELAEIVVVNDGSSDRTAEIAAHYPVRLVHGSGEGPGAARNRGWRTTEAELVWFVDADCVAEPDTLPQLRTVLEATGCAGVGGTYTNGSPESLLATLIDDEIAARHGEMGDRVDYLATFNVLYRRDALDKVGGFNETLARAEDVDLAWRILRAGGELGFASTSRVAHFHERRLWPYLKTQAANGYWRALLYASHPRRAAGDSYSSWLDHLPPVLALAALAGLALGPLVGPAPALAAVALTAGLQAPLALHIGRARGWRHALAFWGLGTARSLTRGVGLALGAAVALRRAHPRVRTAGKPPR